MDKEFSDMMDEIEEKLRKRRELPHRIEEKRSRVVERRKQWREVTEALKQKELRRVFRRALQVNGDLQQ